MLKRLGSTEGVQLEKCLEEHLLDDVFVVGVATQVIANNTRHLRVEPPHHFPPGRFVTLLCSEEEVAVDRRLGIRWHRVRGRYTGAGQMPSVIRFWILTKRYANESASIVPSTPIQKKSNSIFGLNRQHLKGDLFGGVTAGIVAIPLALAFGVSSGLGASYGIYGAFALGIVAALFGGTPVQISGPTGPMTVISAMVIAAAVAEFGSVEGGLGLIVASFLTAGMFQILMGVAGVGRFIRYIPYPVLSGFMSGIGAIIILLQLFPLLGQVSPEGGTLGAITNLHVAPGGIDWPATLVGIATIGVIYLFPKITKAVPSALVALVSVTLIAYLLKLEIPRIDDVQSGFPQVLLGKMAGLHWEHGALVLKFGAMLAALGAIDSLLTSVVADSITKTRHRPSRELVGQGLGNMVSACIGGLPGAGATMRTVVNVKAGGRTKLSGVIHGLLLFALLVGAGPLAATIPLSVLAGILITVGIEIIDYKGFRQLTNMPRTDAFILILVLVLTVFWNLLFAVIIGMLVAAVMFMKQSGDVGEVKSRAGKLSDFADDETWAGDAEIPPKLLNRVFIKHLDGPLFFGFVFSFKDLSADMPDVDHVIIRMRDVPFIDQTGAYALEETLVDLRDRDITVAITGLNDIARGRLERMGIIPKLIREDRIFKDFEECLNWLTLQSANGTTNSDS
jgi:SulP family sulfate permease